MICEDKYKHFSEEEYDALETGGELITKKIRQFGYYYGIKPAEIKGILNDGHHVLLETTLWGISQIKNHLNNIISIFIAPPSLAELKRRLAKRHRDGDGEIAMRLELAGKVLNECKPEMVDYYVINYDLALSIETVNSIVAEEKLKLKNRSGR